MSLEVNVINLHSKDLAKLLDGLGNFYKNFNQYTTVLIKITFLKKDC